MSLRLAGKPVAEAIRRRVAEAVRELVADGGRAPGLAVVLVGEDPASEVYVASKTRSAEEVGFEERTVRLPADSDETRVANVIDELNDDPTVDGILVQLPLPGELSERDLLLRIHPGKDVDGLHPTNVGRLWNDDQGFVPCTPGGIVELLRHYAIELEGRNAVIVGRSQLVGKPMAGLLLREHCTVTLCHSRTRDLEAQCRNADLLIAAIGRPGFFGPEHVSPEAVVVDVGINRVTDRSVAAKVLAADAAKLDRFDERGSALVGDVRYAEVAPQVAAITPVPGGVGLLTVAMLLDNTLQASRRAQGRG